MNGMAETPNAQDVLYSLAQIAEENLAAVRHILSELRDINARLGYAAETGAPSTSAVSSIQIEDNPTKDRIVRLTTKIYAGSPLDVDAALETHARAHRLAEARALDGWQATVVSLEEAKRVDAELRAAAGAAPRSEP